MSACSDTAAGPASLRVLTFNVLCSFCAKADHDPWKARVPHLQALLKEYDADIIGLQELTPSSFAQAPDGDEPALMIATHPDYVPLFYKATASDAPFPDYPDATLYVRKGRFEVLEHGYYWLGPTPDVAFSGSFKATSFHRIVGWARVRDAVTDRVLYLANTHFDAANPNQEKSAPVVMARLPADRDERDRALVMGDFNADPDHKAFKLLTADQPGGGKLREARDIAADKRIRHNDKTEPAYDPAERIDHIFAGEAFTAVRWTVDMRRFGPNNRYPSDHFLIAADLAY